MITIQNQQVDPSNIEALTFEREAGKPIELVVIFKDKKETIFKACEGHSESELTQHYDALQVALMELQQKER
jgi:hypothetical protein